MGDGDETAFIFVGENLALDLVNTEIISRRKQYDLLQSLADLGEWWKLAQDQHPEMDTVRGINGLTYDAILLETVKELRHSLRALFSQIVAGEQPGQAETTFLNSILQRGSPSLTWTPDNTPEYRYWVGNDAHAELLLPVALAALNLITRADLERLHHCHNNHCILMFYDTTKSATRRWCTTACMDRERSARRYREQKKRT